MSKQDLIKVVQRSINDAAFRRQLTTDTANAIRGYSLTPDEVGALRSRDSGKLTAFGVDTRMSKVFAIDQGALGSATITSESGAIGNAAVTGGGPRDAAPVWVGDGAAHGAIQTPDAAERNASIIGDPQLSATSVQSPDAVDRNLAVSSTGSEPRDSEPVWVGDLGNAATGAVQSPDAMERNAAFTGGAEPRDSDPVWIGDLGNAATGAVQSPDAMDRNAAFTGSGTEPRDSDPVWIGDTAAPLDAHAAPIDGSPEADSTGDLSTGDGNLQQ
ncbi:MAG: hypothetical protein E6I57_12660 [Chloroflexi bacterium]|nr:MAG: hypothetical protein E6J49_04525 [Chloroflexota bacterium]TMB97158.1 MAG: hypothetical protein E6J38_02220 [Chloroflexota bacterium]TMC28272.1 MAG: hypothetical protein E6J27_09110 [Chloroflexota bacterium]TMC36572.1 MAG: hypothetical protein E6J24_02115 [Chloroflexota bacterium]TMC56893.1 MAG: hypothetical protein E6J19_07690 [Chloroflexota bacterium]